MDGVLILDKPNGITSHDAVLFIRRNFGIKRVGHAGTLDPMATGVLVILLGKATKLSNRLINDNKEYEAVMELGTATDTGDIEGRVISRHPLDGITDDRIKEAFGAFAGDIEQVPPMVSAIKLNGKKLYELARKGIEVERRPRSIRIHELRIISIDGSRISFYAHCSKGTYIRKLAGDIGEKLGCGARLLALRRISSGTFHIKDAVDMDSLKDDCGIEVLKNSLIRYEDIPQ